MNVGSFDVNSRQAFQQVEIMLKELKFEIGEVWNYDPHGIISNRRKEINASTYEYEYKPELESKDNLSSWPINIEMEVETPSTKKNS